MLAAGMGSALGCFVEIEAIQLQRLCRPCSAAVQEHFFAAVAAAAAPAGGRRIEGSGGRTLIAVGVGQKTSGSVVHDLKSGVLVYSPREPDSRHQSRHRRVVWKVKPVDWVLVAQRLGARCFCRHRRLACSLASQKIGRPAPSAAQNGACSSTL